MPIIGWLCGWVVAVIVTLIIILVFELKGVTVIIIGIINGGFWAAVGGIVEFKLRDRR